MPLGFYIVLNCEKCGKECRTEWVDIFYETNAHIYCDNCGSHIYMEIHMKDLVEGDKD
jgi:DNA-directed RNA polymerase subunit RPC12/RpoP